MKFTVEITDNQDFDKSEFVRWLNDQLNLANDATGTETKATLIES
jgi:hypothetical protein